MNVLSEYARMRYDRQMRIQGWGEAGQLKLQSAVVFVAGAGGLGSPVSIYLTAAGVGEIHVADADVVELSNLNRQILHTDARLGESKAVSTRKMLGEMNPTVRIVTHSDYIDETNVDRIVGHPDIVVDCLDNFATRYLLNGYCIKQRIPLVHGAVHGLLGQVTFLSPPETPCLRCIFLDAPPKATFPVLGATPGVIGCIQAMEVLKFLTATGKNLKRELLFFDGTDMTFTKIDAGRMPSCPDCGSLGKLPAHPTA